jgi:hypothetical protein
MRQLASLIYSLFQKKKRLINDGEVTGGRRVSEARSIKERISRVEDSIREESARPKRLPPMVDSSFDVERGWGRLDFMPTATRRRLLLLVTADRGSPAF